MKIINVIVIVASVAIISFLAGVKYQGDKQTGGQFQGQRRGSNANGTRPVVSGEIISLDDKSATVKMQDGSSKIVILSDSTTYSQTSQASKSDLKVGERIGAFGTENSDGTLTAQNVQINPQFRTRP